MFKNIDTWSSRIILCLILAVEKCWRMWGYNVKEMQPNLKYSFIKLSHKKENREDKNKYNKYSETCLRYTCLIYDHC